MNIDKQLQDDHSAKLLVELDQAQMDQYKKRAANRIASRNKIPGFRPGKAPYEVVVRMFGEGAITEQAVDLFIDAEYSNLLKEAEVNPGAAGSLEAIDSLTPPKLTFRVPLAPEVDLGDYHSIRLPYEWQAPGEKDMEVALEDLRQMYATTENVDRAVEMGDYVLLDVNSETTELNRTGFATFVRKEDRDTEWPYNGFARELVGLNAGESKTLQHHFPTDWDLAELQDKDVELTATIKTVRGVILPDVDDDFAKQTGAGDTVEALKEALQKDVTARSQADYDDKYFVDLIEKVKEGATIKYHQHTLEHEGEHVLEDLNNRLSQQGMDLDTYIKVRNTTREKFMEEEVNPVAKKRLERGLILDELVRQERIQLDDKSLDTEYSNAVNNLAMQGMDFSKVRGGRQGQKQLSEAIAMDAANRVITRKALDMLKSIAIGEYKPVAAAAAEETAAEAEAAPQEETSESAEVEGGAEDVAEEKAAD